MSKAFFDQIDDELRGLLGPKLRDYRSYKASRLLKVWYGEGPIHFEAQLVGPRWSATKEPVIEVGLHIELPDAKTSEKALKDIATPSVLKALGGPETGRALGPRGGSWRRISEMIEFTEEDDPDLASEVAERLANYIRVLAPHAGHASGSASS